MNTDKTRPNILFILSDDHGYWALGEGCGGHPALRTPNLDRIAREGVKLENCFCVSPVCSPARASLMTGTVPSAHGVMDWLKGGNIDMRRCPELAGDPNFAAESRAIRYLDGMTCWSDLLAGAGYSLALSGKWHLGDSLSPQHGYTRWYSIGRGGCAYMHPDMADDGRIVYENRYVTDLITDRALTYLDELAAGDAPFCLDVRYTAPHAPWGRDQHPKEIFNRYYEHDFSELPELPDHEWSYPAAVNHHGEKRRELLSGYYTAITAMDLGIGRLLDRLDELGLCDNTLVIFTGDNGMSMGHHGIWGKGNGTFPMNMYDTAVKVPFLIRWPGHTPAGYVCHDMASAYDIFPTFADLLGSPSRICAERPGRSFLRSVEGKKDERGEREIVVFDEYGPVRMIRTREWKYIHRYPYGPHELYDLVNDPEEMDNLADDPAQADRIVEMRARLQKWFLRYADPAKDGLFEGVTGSGQLCSAGLYSEKRVKYAPVPKRRS